jgi:hypothetical protein
VINFFWFSLLPFAWAFIIADALRRRAVKGSHERYRMSGWTWLLLWPTYVWLVVVLVDAAANHNPASIFAFVTNMPYIAYLHHRLRNDDDDNPWRKLRSKLKAGVKRLSQVRVPMPSLAPPVADQAGA